MWLVRKSHRRVPAQFRGDGRGAGPVDTTVGPDQRQWWPSGISSTSRSPDRRYLSENIMALLEPVPTTEVATAELITA